MAGIDIEELTAPVSPEDPSGPDLDLDGDPDFMNFMAKAEGLLPASFFSPRDGKPFDRMTVDFAAEFAAAKPLLARTRDLRLLATLAKFSVLNRDLAGFESRMRAIGSLLESAWDDVHPRSEGGDYTIRMACLESLDDSPTVVLPLQFIPLLQSRRLGTINYRQFMVAKGEVQPKEDEQAFDLPSLEKALNEADMPDLLDTHRLFASIQAEVARIQRVWLDRAGFEQAVNLTRTPQVVAKIIGVLLPVIRARDPSALGAAAEVAAEPVAMAGSQSSSVVAAPSASALASTADAMEALAAIAAYFSRCEPSNPALLLVRQAEQLVGKSFLEVMNILVPAHVGEAMIGIGVERFFELPVQQLSPFALDNGEDGKQAAANGAPKLEANTRAEAFGLLDQVAACYRKLEPSSPIAAICERARRLAERDFMGLLSDLLPETVLKTPQTEGS